MAVDASARYDPCRSGEVSFVEAWYAALEATNASLVLRRNYPYRGVSDSLVTYLRRRYGARRYVGMELEINQKHVDSPHWPTLVAVLAETLAAAVGRG